MENFSTELPLEFRQGNTRVDNVIAFPFIKYSCNTSLIKRFNLNLDGLKGYSYHRVKPKQAIVAGTAFFTFSLFTLLIGLQ